MKWDKYEFHARLRPAIWVAFPIALAVLAWFPNPFAGWEAFVALIPAFGVLGLFALLARKAGRDKQDGLWETWGGSPTMRLLRRRDTSLDWVTLERTHQILAERVGVPAPSKGEEEADTETADQVYEGYTHHLKEMTRDKKVHDLVAAENINYGVSRNTWGLKPYGIGASSIGLIASGIAIYFKWTASPLMAIAATIVCLVWLVLWCCYITRSLVKVAGDGYAKALIGAAERLENKSKAA
jgi:hypothetical protein